MGLLNDMYEGAKVRNDIRRMEKEQRENYLASEEYKRLRMYEDVHIIKKWFVFWSWLTVIGLIIYVLSAFFAALMTMPA